jgi:hypothetical protein
MSFRDRRPKLIRAWLPSSTSVDVRIVGAVDEEWARILRPVRGTADVPGAID